MHHPPQPVTVRQLAEDLINLSDRCHHSKLCWVGLAGPPGSGKSTLAAKLKEELRELLAVVPMDGYHFYRRQLDELEDPILAHARRGAPFTFDSKRFVTDVITAKQKGCGSFPAFDHGIGDPIESVVRLGDEECRIVLVEGNYLLLDNLPWSRLRDEVFDETWYLDVPVSICKQRVYQRHIKTGKTATEAAARVKSNDGPNAELVHNESRINADRLITLSPFTA